MILILFIWLYIFFIFYVIGFSVVKTIDRITKNRDVDNNFGVDHFFFLGFLTLSVVAGILSIVIPIDNKVLFSVTLLTLVLFLVSYRELITGFKEIFKSVSLFSWAELLILCFLIFFILTAVVQKITLGDTESYHAQTIQWIRKYSVVPGLGNIHGRLAFNSMFFVISALFTIQIKDILIFPINGICFIVFGIKLFLLISREIKLGTAWRTVFYCLIFLIGIFILIPDLNSPSPDIICTILILYIFNFIFEKAGKVRDYKYSQLILLNLVVFSCIGYKLSSILVFISLLFFLEKDFLRRSLITFVIFIMVFTPFLIRNYFLSGYLFYPLPGIDIFSVDWKIPHENVLAMKSEIEGFARLSALPYTEVAKMQIQEWILPWFRGLNFNNKLMVIGNSFSIITFIVMLIRRDFYLAKIQAFVYLNIAFWFLMAPDPRFAYGFIFAGFSLTISYLIMLIEYSSQQFLLRYIKIGLLCFLFLIIYRRVNFPVETIKNPKLWIISAPFGTVATNNFHSNFEYRVPVPEGGCFNVEIPCVPFPLKDVVLRGKDLQSGFKQVSAN